MKFVQNFKITEDYLRSRGRNKKGGEGAAGPFSVSGGLV